MDHFREVKNTLKWHKEGKFEVELVNGVINKLMFCEPGKGPEDAGRSLTSTSYKFLQSVYSCLGDLFTFIEEENKRLGYKYAREVEIQPYHEDGAEENTYPMVTETKLRPLINYNNKAEYRALTGESEPPREVDQAV
jgi:hypothetical protein